MSVIDIDFDVARKQAVKLDSLADDLERIKNNEYAPAMEQVRGNWTGDSANAYLGKGATLEGDFEATIKSIRSVASDIRGTVDKIEAAQKAAQAVIAEKNT